jgi:RNA polymerase sigma-70 factor (ECF subfamily)
MTESEEAVRKFQAGDEDGFTEIVRQWEKRIFNLAWRFVGSREDAQDVVQETFLSVFKSVNGLRDPKSFPSWLYRIALNHCRARWRSRTDDVYLEDSISADGVGNEVAVYGSAVRPDEPVETADLIRKAMAGLSDEHRTAIILKEYLGLNLEEVARVMDCPLSTAKSRLYHGLRGVQRNLRRIGASAK